MRAALRLLCVLAVLLVSCTPEQREVAGERSLQVLRCGLLAGAKALVPQIVAALGAQDWRGEMRRIQLGTAVPGLLECGTAEAVRWLDSKHQAADTAMVAMEPPPTDKQVARDRGARWLLEQPVRVSL